MNLGGILGVGRSWPSHNPGRSAQHDASQVAPAASSGPTPAAPTMTAPDAPSKTPQPPAQSAPPASPPAASEPETRRVSRQIVSQPPSVAPVQLVSEPEDAAVADVERSRAAALATFKAKQVESWIAQIAGADAGGLPFVLHEPASTPADAERTGGKLSELYEEF